MSYLNIAFNGWIVYLAKYIKTNLILGTSYLAFNHAINTLFMDKPLQFVLEKFIYYQL